MLEKIKKHKGYVILAVALCLSIIFAVTQYSRAEKLSYRQKLEYNRVFAELTEYVDDLEISLLKGQVISSPTQMAKLSGELYSQASAAKANLSMLPLDNIQMEKTQRFLSQVGEYATSISLKMLKGEELTQKEIEDMQSLSKYADMLKQGFDKMLTEINEGNMSFNEEKGIAASLMRGEENIISKELTVLEEEFHDYPSLVYDGPFSQHLELKKSPFLNGKLIITSEQAKSRSKSFIKDEKIFVSEIGGNLPSYNVKGENAFVEFTKQGGVLLLLMRDRHIDEEKLSEKEAMKKAEMFLRDNGFMNMKESYFEKRDGSIVINYAFSQDEYVVFPDLVKVKVALDNGEIIGFESRGYVMNHIYREIPQEKITAQEALENVSPSLEVLDITKAIIPLENGSEACCFQIKGVVEDKHFLMYVNTQTGQTEDVQILLESENGTLAV